MPRRALDRLYLDRLWLAAAGLVVVAGVLAVSEWYVGRWARPGGAAAARDLLIARAAAVALMCVWGAFALAWMGRRARDLREAAARSRQELEQRVQERTAELAAANEGLRRAAEQHGQMWEVMQRASDHVQRLLAAGPAVLFTCRARGDYGLTFVSGNAEAVLGVSADDLLAARDRWRELVHPDDLPRLLGEGAALLERGSHSATLRVRVRGEVRWLHLDLRAVAGPDGAPHEIVGAAIDITERRAMLDRLIVQDRTATVGTLAAAIAHELNDPMSWVLGSLELAGEELDKFVIAWRAWQARARAGSAAEGQADAALAEWLRQIDDLLARARSGADRVRAIAGDLRSLSRAEHARGPTDLGRVIGLALRVAGAEIRQRARLVVADGPAPLVDGDEARLSQLFLHVLLDTARALPAGDPEAQEVRVSAGAGPGGRVLVEVARTGPGPAAPGGADRPAPPEPGGGPGPWIARSLAESLGGDLAVEPAPGGGAVTRIALPRAGAVRPPVLTPVPPRASRRARVLVVDDEPAVADLIARVLDPAHEVTCVPAAGEALALIRGGRRFDLILCDLIMPVVSGMDLHETLQRDAPDQAERMVFFTGGAFTDRAQAFLDRVTNPRLHKPFSLDEVRALVSQEQE